ncbi:hypothetical protein [Pararhodobacter zhoushanensis]|uniref:Uncharacterized protein n=1 Tax=Pararhodobacter zhoushanensis TaxID=2479545 RepID=A0ABT3H0R4_9RHOB|nr:hypothetical protein [Pararhodobacter zhoushanensis]MCW1933379.1 hypothetical protein [Pararhodobacter zhoushanensis]
MKSLITAVAVVVALGGSAVAAETPSTANLWGYLVTHGSEAVVQPASCCRVCRTGYACGNSCISRSYRCHQPRGCACDG